ncbi:DUF2946 family protein [Bradyrhizobium oligotrophicum]|uniref:DUF2946 family protein n=1 Tax=Bradyrhizobium oligotrophicum TaxID=44255 RepID=UPI003EBF309C
MRQRLQAFFPIMLIALWVQILAPVDGAWAAAIAASDPLRGAQICHGQRESQPTFPGNDESQGKPGRHVCDLCCAAQPAALDGPDPSVSAAVRRESCDVVWFANSPGARLARACSHPQARAPPGA